MSLITLRRGRIAPRQEERICNTGFVGGSHNGPTLLERLQNDQDLAFALIQNWLKRLQDPMTNYGIEMTLEQCKGVAAKTLEFVMPVAVKILQDVIRDLGDDTTNLQEVIKIMEVCFKHSETRPQFGTLAKKLRCFLSVGTPWLIEENDRQRQLKEDKQKRKIARAQRREERLAREAKEKIAEAALFTLEGRVGNKPLEPPQISAHPSDVMVLESHPAVFETIIRNVWTARVRYTWEYERCRISPTKGRMTMLGDGRRLLIRRGITFTRGRYKCIVENEKGKDESREACLRLVKLRSIEQSRTPLGFPVKSGTCVGSTSTTLLQGWQDWRLLHPNGTDTLSGPTQKRIIFLHVDKRGNYVIAGVSQECLRVYENSLFESGATPLSEHPAHRKRRVRPPPRRIALTTLLGNRVTVLEGQISSDIADLDTHFLDFRSEEGSHNKRCYLALLTKSGSFRVWDLATKQRVFSMSFAEVANVLSCNPEAHHVAIALQKVASRDKQTKIHTDASEIRIVDWSQGSRVTSFVLGSGTRCLTYSANGRYIAYVENTRCKSTIIVQDWKAKRIVCRFKDAHAGFVSRGCLTWMPSNFSFLASAGEEGVVKLWDIDGAQCIMNKKVHEKRVTMLLWSKNQEEASRSGKDPPSATPRRRLGGLEFDQLWTASTDRLLVKIHFTNLTNLWATRRSVLDWAGRIIHDLMFDIYKSGLLHDYSRRKRALKHSEQLLQPETIKIKHSKPKRQALMPQKQVDDDDDDDDSLTPQADTERSHRTNRITCLSHMSEHGLVTGLGTLQGTIEEEGSDDLDSSSDSFSEHSSHCSSDDSSEDEAPGPGKEIKQLQNPSSSLLGPSPQLRPRYRHSAGLG